MNEEQQMPNEIKTINLSMPLNLGSVNCYLKTAEGGFCLIDTGGSNKRRELVNTLEESGCRPGDLKLILITHGDIDHIGNAAYLRERYGTKIAMHPDDSGMADHGDIFWNRHKPNFLVKIFSTLLVRLPRSDRFKADIPLEDGYDLTGYGFKAEVLSIPGHSRGSVGILTHSSDLFCGDLFENLSKPRFNSIMDDFQAANDSLEKLMGYEIKDVYPGHGKPFKMRDFMEDYIKNT
jgi:hydroxyacylglutathione hydrolase